MLVIGSFAVAIPYVPYAAKAKGMWFGTWHNNRN
jgi:hypothetical protein